MRILILDIETSPNIAHVWGLFKQNVGLSQLMEGSETICWAAKWYGEDGVSFSSIHHDNKDKMLATIWQLLDAADVVVHYNGTAFDIPTLNKEFVMEGMEPPSTYRQIDLLKTVKNRFRFPSNKLEYVARALGLGGKVSHEGHELWVKCMAGISEAWEKMREYNTGDVRLTEEVYNVLLPWLHNPPNQNMYTDGSEAVCPQCGSTKLHKRGYTYTNISKFQRYRCMDCGGWSRGRQNLQDREHAVMPIV